MALLTCKECGGKVSDGAAACPACGAKPPQPTSRLTILIGGLFIFVVARCALYEPTSTPAAKPAVATSSPPPAPPAPTPIDPKFLKEFSRIDALSPEKFCAGELRKLRGKKDPLPQPWFRALVKAGTAHGIAEADYSHIQAGGVVPGMNRCGALAAWGRPEKVNTTTSARSTREQWVYGNGNYLYFTDQILTSIQN